MPFEKLDNHIVNDGRALNVPIYLSEGGEGMTDKTIGLMHAVDIIGGNLNHLEGGLGGLALTIANLSTAPKYEPETEVLTIADGYSTSSVKVDGLNTHISVYNVGEWDVDTALFEEMVREWANYESPQAHTTSPKGTRESEDS